MADLGELGERMTVKDRENIMTVDARELLNEVFGLYLRSDAAEEAHVRWHGDITDRGWPGKVVCLDGAEVDEEIYTITVKRMK